MKDRLTSLKEMIEKEVGFSLTKRDQRRHVTYARAVYCKIAREMNGEESRPTSLVLIGEVIERDHATVLHNVKVIFEFAMMEKEYKRLYNMMREVFVLSEVDIDIEDEERKELSERIIQLKKENEQLRNKVAVAELEGGKFTDLTIGLSQSEMDEIYEKLSIMVKSIRSRVYV